MRREWTMEKKKQRRKRRAFTPEFKAEAVRLCRVGDRTIAQVAGDLDLTETALREWVKRADIDAGKGPLRRSRRPSAKSWQSSVATTSGSRWSATF